MKTIPARRGAACLAAAALLWSLCATGASAADTHASGVHSHDVSADVSLAFDENGERFYCTAPHGPERPATPFEGVVVRLGGAFEQLAPLAERLVKAGATVEALDPVGFQQREIIVRDGDARVEAFGEWNPAGSESPTGWVRFTAWVGDGGLYPVYVRAGEGASMAAQEYIVIHENGETHRRVNHAQAGDGWIYLGTFSLDGWAHVETSDSRLPGDAGTLAIPAAVRFGNGLGEGFGTGRASLSQNGFASEIVGNINGRLRQLDPEWADAWTSAVSGGVSEDGSAELIFRDSLSNAASIPAGEVREAVARASHDGLAAILSDLAGVEPVASPGAPASAEIAENARGRRVLRWTAPADGDAPDAYSLQYSDDGRAFSEANLIDGDKLEADLEGLLMANATRHFRVAAVNGAGESAPSPSVQIFHSVPGAFHGRGGTNCGETGEPEIFVPDQPITVPASARSARPAGRATIEACAYFGDVNEIDMGSAATVSGGPSKGVVASTSGNLLYYVPTLPDNGEAGVPDTDTDTITLSTGDTINITITKGFTDNCATGTSTNLDTYRVQQRLKYFGYYGSNSAVLAVDGAVGGNTRWAIGVFSAAAGNTQHSSLASFTAAGSSFINAGNAPRWIEMPGGGGSGWNNIDADSHDFGTSWAKEVTDAAGAGNSTGTSFGTNDLSKKRGGDTPDHASHEAGMDIDVDTPGLEGQPTNSFYAVHGNGLIRSNSGGYVVLSGGSYIDSASSSGAVSASAAHNNFTILGTPGFGASIASPAGYNLATVTGHMEAYMNATGDPSGATVGNFYYNDPRTHGLAGWTVPVNYATDHNGHFHVDISPPTPTAPDNPGGGGGPGGGGDPPSGDFSVDVTSAAVESNSIGVTLTAPGSETGTLVLKLGSHTLYSATHGAGTITANFGTIDSLPEGAYTGIDATWTVGGNNYTDSFGYAIRVLGVYRHSQYNIPAESHATCQGGGTANIWITNASCNFTASTFPGTFRSQVALNGRGTSVSYGVAVVEQFCLTHANNTVGATMGWAFRRNGTISGNCDGSSTTVNNTTVAANSGHPYLGCNDRVYIHSAGTSGVVKTVTDRCPACGAGVNYKQLDNFTTDGRCSGITDFGNFMTIKLP